MQQKKEGQHSVMQRVRNQYREAGMPSTGFKKRDIAYYKVGGKWQKCMLIGKIKENDIDAKVGELWRVKKQDGGMDVVGEVQLRRRPVY